MNQLQLFLPCAGGVEDMLAAEVRRIVDGAEPQKARGGVGLSASWRDLMRLNLHSRLAQRVLVQLWHGPYRDEQDLYDATSDVAWEIWFTPAQTIKVEITAQHSPLTSLNFAALKIKDAVCDRFRHKRGERPSVDTHRPDVRLHAHLTHEALTLYIDTSGEPLFKRGWREDTGDAPLKETLAAAMVVSTGWDQQAREAATLDQVPPLFDPCCGSGTVLIEAVQIALNIPAGAGRRFAFEKLLPCQPHVWRALWEQAVAEQRPWPEGQAPIAFGSDVSFRMVDFAQRNAERAGVAQAIEFRGGDALQRKPPVARPGVMLLNPPYGERIAAAGVAGRNAAERARSFTVGREAARTDDGDTADAFFERLASHWKQHFAGWTAWLLTPDLKLPGRMRFRESRRVPLWNGPLECRLFRFDLVARKPRPEPPGP